MWEKQLPILSSYAIRQMRLYWLMLTKTVQKVPPSTCFIEPAFTNRLRFVRADMKNVPTPLSLLSQPESQENPLIIVVSNPADILTAEVQAVSGLPANRVIGSGTSLDTARFRANISHELDVNVKDIHAYVLGEHGDSQVAAWSSVTIGGVPLADYEKQANISLDREQIASHTKNGGAEIIELKGATFYGVAMAVSSIVEVILKDSHAILPVAYVLGKEFGDWAGISFSLPCKIGQNGIEQAFVTPLDKEEKKAMDHSATILRDFYNQVKAS